MNPINLVQIPLTFLLWVIVKTTEPISLGDISWNLAYISACLGQHGHRDLKWEYQFQAFLDVCMQKIIMNHP